MATPEPRPGTAEFDRLYDEYRASGGHVSWERWLVDRPEDVSSTPLGDALAKVDRVQGDSAGFLGDVMEELEALRDLAEAVRLYLSKNPEQVIPLRDRH